MFTKIALVTLLGSASFAANATTLLDGSFETKGAALPVTNYCYDGRIAAGNAACAPGAWVGGGVIREGVTAWGKTNSPEGIYYGFVQAKSTVSQTFVATGRQTGVLTWIDTNRTNLGGSQSYVVTISDGMTSTMIGSFTSAIGGWVSRTSSSFDLINGRSYTLSFKGTGVGDVTTFIDGVSLATTSVPEASTWSMLLAGFGLIGFAARRRQVAAAA